MDIIESRTLENEDNQKSEIDIVYNNRLLCPKCHNYSVEYVIYDKEWRCNNCNKAIIYNLKISDKDKYQIYKLWGIEALSEFTNEHIEKIERFVASYFKRYCLEEKKENCIYYDSMRDLYGREEKLKLIEKEIENIREKIRYEIEMEKQMERQRLKEELEKERQKFEDGKQKLQDNCKQMLKEIVALQNSSDKTKLWLEKIKNAFIEKEIDNIENIGYRENRFTAIFTNKVRIVCYLKINKNSIILYTRSPRRRIYTKFDITDENDITKAVKRIQKSFHKIFIK